MKLSEPAEKLWRTHRDTLHRIAADIAGPSPLLLGGGTILNGDWGHRESVDIDALLPGRRNVTDLHPGRRLDLANAVNGKAVVTTEHRIVVRTAAGILDITAMDPPIRGIERGVDVAGRNETVLRPSQILRGKLSRIHKALDRDAFDLITAARADPVALEIAVNALDADSRSKAREHLRSRDRRNATEWAHELFRVPARYQTPLDTLGADAAETLKRHEYARVQIYQRQDATTILTFPRHGKPRTLEIAGDPETAIRKSGMQDYLDNNSTVSSYEIERALQEAVKKTATVLVLDTGEDDPRERVDRILHKSAQAPAKTGRSASQHVVRGKGRPVGGDARKSDGLYEPDHYRS